MIVASSISKGVCLWILKGDLSGCCSMILIPQGVPHHKTEETADIKPPTCVTPPCFHRIFSRGLALRNAHDPE